MRISLVQASVGDPFRLYSLGGPNCSIPASRAAARDECTNQRALFAAAYPVTEATSLLGPEPPSDPEEGLDLLTRELCNKIVESEPPAPRLRSP